MSKQLKPNKVVNSQILSQTGMQQQVVILLGIYKFVIVYATLISIYPETDYWQDVNSQEITSYMVSTRHYPKH